MVEGKSSLCWYNSSSFQVHDVVCVLICSLWPWGEKKHAIYLWKFTDSHCPGSLLKVYFDQYCYFFKRSIRNYILIMGISNSDFDSEHNLGRVLCYTCYKCIPTQVWLWFCQKDKKFKSNNCILNNSLYRVCAKKKKRVVSVSMVSFFLAASAITLSFYLNNVKRVIVSHAVYKWPLLLQITVTVFYATSSDYWKMINRNYTSEACPEYPFTLLKPSKKAHQYHSDNRRIVNSGLICT